MSLPFTASAQAATPAPRSSISPSQRLRASDRGRRRRFAFADPLQALAQRRRRHLAVDQQHAAGTRRLTLSPP
jgi:hypothetical protein